MTGEEVPDHHHVARYCGPSKLEDGFPSPANFLPRMQDGRWEEHLSSNWLEWFGQLTRRQALNKIRDTKRGFSMRPAGKFAVLHVAKIRQNVSLLVDMDLAVRHMPNDQDISHCGIFGYSHHDEAALLEMAMAIHSGLSTSDVLGVRPD